MSDEQNGRNGERRRFTAQQKVAILKEHLVEKLAVSEVCDRHGLNPTAFYRWQKEFFENGAPAFEGRRSAGDAKAIDPRRNVWPTKWRLCIWRLKRARTFSLSPKAPTARHRPPRSPSSFRSTSRLREVSGQG